MLAHELRALCSCVNAHVKHDNKPHADSFRLLQLIYKCLPRLFTALLAESIASSITEYSTDSLWSYLNFYRKMLLKLMQFILNTQMNGLAIFFHNYPIVLFKSRHF
jgi:hypothetical protein